MPNETLPTDLTDMLLQLTEKYAAMGQDLSAYLEGLLQADYLTYWDYIHLETLLSLQNPRTAYPDELIFITYHQSTELYFKLILHEVAQIAYHPDLTAHFFTDRMKRINRYFELLENSYAVMIEGMEKEQFLKFRMALLPSSGFQSVQFREIEIVSTDFVRLLAGNFPEKTDPHQSVADWFPFLYWQAGATELATQQKTLTLKQFESHYADRIIRLADDYQSRNLWQRFLQVKQTGAETDALIAQLREYDHRLNVRWKSLHLRSAMRYLHQNADEIKTTGGTNWQKYLPPREQKRIFYPQLWSETEQREWGKMNKNG